jgi:hypothetical protein
VLYLRVSCQLFLNVLSPDWMLTLIPTLLSIIVGEVKDLKDSLGGGETLDNEAGVTTRGAENDAYAQEKKVDNLDL